MKKYFAILGALVLAVTVAKISIERLRVDQVVSESPKEKPEVLGKPTENSSYQHLSFSYEQRTYNVELVITEAVESITLNDNLVTKISALDAFSENKCHYLVSGGFYTKENTHTGLFISDYEKLTTSKESDLFDGFLSVNALGTPRITKVIPIDKLRFALQTGPMLVENGKTLKLSMANDKFARRTATATTGGNKLIFLIIYDPESKYQGPELGSLPQILEIIQEKSGIAFADAINLDGGTASAFVSEEITLTEASPVGNYFCIKN